VFGKDLQSKEDSQASLRADLGRLDVRMIDCIKVIEAKLMTGAGGDVEAARQDIILQVKGAIQPFIALVARLSDTKADPGGLIVKRVAHLEAQVVLLTATANPPLAAAPAISSRVSLAWTIPSSTPPPTTPPPQPTAGPEVGGMAQLQNTVTGL
jgi:hypothetical protein